MNNTIRTSVGSMPQSQHPQRNNSSINSTTNLRSFSSFFSAFSLSPLTLSLSPSLLSVAIYVLCISAFVSPFFTVSLARSQFLVLTQNWISSPNSSSAASTLFPTIFYLLYVLLCFALCIAVCLSLSFVTFANSITSHDSH
ncbi:unnamed protein product [Calypogeia fissa]